MIRFKYSALSDWLKKQIQDGSYREGDKIPTEDALAKQFSVSRDTVRKAISGLEKENLLRRVKGSGTYVCSPTDNIPSASSNSKRIGVLMNDIDTYIFPSILKGINKALTKQGYSPIVRFTNNYISQERSILEDFLSGNFDGVIIEPTKSALPQVNYDLYQQLSRTLPAVLIHSKIPTLPLSSITIGDEEGSLKLTSHLLEKGYKNIALFCKYDEQTGTERYLGYAKAYQKAGLPIPDNNIFLFSSENISSLFGDPLDEKIREILLRCTAVICHDDRLAMSLYKYLRDHEVYRKDMVICSFDDSDIAVEYHFTSIAHPKEEFGEYAAMRLLEKIKDPASDVSFDFRPKLIIRNQE